jgi:hypothetical protein
LRTLSKKGFSGMKNNHQSARKENQERSHLSLTREQLYELAWSKPMQHLAKDYGVSDRAMAKLCARNQVPVPPRGYWARMRSGYRVDRPPLRAFAAKEKPKPEPPAKQDGQKPEKKKAKPSSEREDREKKIKQILRDHRSRLSGGVHYAVLVEGWSCDYSFGLNTSFDPLRCKDNWDSIIYGEPFEETRSLVFKGRFHKPPKLKEERVEVRLRQRAHLNEVEREKNLSYYTEHPPKAVGSLHKEKPFSWCSVSIPEAIL